MTSRPILLTAIILTNNESIHIERCIRSLSGVASQVIVVDSNSTDDTVKKARACNAEVYINPWVNYSTQFNWALDNLSIQGEWTLRIDADEYITPQLRLSLKKLFTIDPGISGFFVHRHIVFLQRLLRWGGCRKLSMLRIFRTGLGRCEQRWMDEHMIIHRGTTELLEGSLIDENLRNIGWWLDKHNSYATREAIDLLNIQYKFENHTDRNRIGIASQAGRKRILKELIYARLPMTFRAFVYFLYRYIFLLGFLDGQAGFAFCFLQGFWYRYVVDLKVNEIKCRAQRDSMSIAEAVFAEYGINVTPPAHH